MESGLEKGRLEFQVSSEVTCIRTPLASSPEKKKVVCVTLSQGCGDGLLLKGSSLGSYGLLIHTGPIELFP